MNVDTAADTCILATNDVERLGISVDIKLFSSILKSYGVNPIRNLGTTNFQVTFKNPSVTHKVYHCQGSRPALNDPLPACSQTLHHNCKR